MDHEIKEQIKKRLPDKVLRQIYYTRKYGAAAELRHIFQKENLDMPQNAAACGWKVTPPVYDEWRRQTLPTEQELGAQRSALFASMPKISILVPLMHAKPPYVQAMLDSVCAQTYANWELCLAIGDPLEKTVVALSEQYAKKDTRIRLRYCTDKSPAGCLNAALEMASGAFVGLLGCNGMLEATACYEIVRCLNADAQTEVLYTDEGKVCMREPDCIGRVVYTADTSCAGSTESDDDAGQLHDTARAGDAERRYFAPDLKPDFNLDLLRSTNYIAHFFVVRKALAEQAGGFCAAYGEAQEYDFILRCCERVAVEKICHIPKPLYHSHARFQPEEEPLTGDMPDSPVYSAEIRALEAHLARMGVEAHVSMTNNAGIYRVTYPVQGTPKVSILIPNRNEMQTLKTCVDSILEKTTYPNYEIILIENNSDQEEIFAYYRTLEKNEKIQVVTWEGTTFNYSALNNFGVTYAKGEYLLLLNNDTEVISADWLEQLLGNCQRPEVGIAGAKLYYPDDTIQHAGIIIGRGGLAGHAMTGLKRTEDGYRKKASVQADYSAVTAACLMVKKEVYESVGGLDEHIAVAFNDVDFCLRVRSRGLLVVYDPYVELYHYESKSRKTEDTPEKQQRFAQEVAYVSERWAAYLPDRDPCYNPNWSQSLAYSCYTLKEQEAKTPVEPPQTYQSWRERHQCTPQELEEQRRAQFSYHPKFSIVVPLYRTPPVYLKEMIQSVQAQTYENWELCLSDGSGADSPLTEALENYKNADGRIRIISNEKQLQISENTNQALAAAQGDWIVFADHDDLLAPDALYECVRALNQDRTIELLYSDEDKISMDGKTYFEPHFKTDFNIDLLCSMNYICHMFVVSRQIFEQTGYLDSRFDGAQDYDFVLRCVERAKNICHIPKALYHWRAHKDSTAENPESKRYAFEAGRRAVQAHYDRVGIPAKVHDGEYPGLYRTEHLLRQKPLISLIIPNKDHIEDLETCISSIETKSSYGNYEFVIVENNSEKEETFQYYRTLEEKNPKVRIVYWDGPFNYSAINDFGVRAAKGDYLLLLNNDTEMISADALEQMVGYCMHEAVGAVGARLYYADDTIQHAGVIVGFGGCAGHAFIGMPRSANGYFSRIICAQDMSAVTAACMLVKRSVYEEVGGLDARFRVAYNDIDFCLRIRQAGHLVVYNPYAEFYHYESKSRGYENTEEKLRRFHDEAGRFAEKWYDVIKAGDPYYNPNLSIERGDFGLR